MLKAVCAVSLFRCFADVVATVDRHSVARQRYPIYLRLLSHHPFSLNIGAASNMRDIESDRQPLNNPYAAGVGPTTLPARHPINILKRCIYMGLSIWGLHKLQVYRTILRSPDVQHEWFKIGLASSVGTWK